MPTPAASRRFYWPDQRELPLAVALVLFCFAPLVIALSKPASAVLLVLSVALTVFFVVREGQATELLARFRAFWRSVPGLLLAGLLAWLAVTILWSAAPARGTEYTLHMIACAIIGVGGLCAARMAFAHSFTGYFLGGIIIASLWLIGNTLTGQEAVRVIGIERVLTNSNRSCVALALLLPLMAEIVRVSRSVVWVSIAAVCAIAAISIGTSETAKLAMLLGLFVMVLSRYAAALATFFSVIVPGSIILLPFYIGSINALVPEAVHQRLGYLTVTVRGEMWEAYGKLIPMHWLRGFGVETSSVMPKVAEVSGFSEKTRGLLGWNHPHNAPLQTWVELGLPGALLVTALVFFYFRWASALQPRPRRLALAGGVQAVAVSFVSHGAWQVWWYALCTLTAMLTIFVLKTLQERR